MTYGHANPDHSILPPHPVDLVTVAQDFHWFDKTLLDMVYQRTLKEDSYVLAIGNLYLKTMIFENQ